MRFSRCREPRAFHEGIERIRGVQQDLVRRGVVAVQMVGNEVAGRLPSTDIDKAEVQGHLCDQFRIRHLRAPSHSRALSAHGCPPCQQRLLQLEQIVSGYPSRERFLTELTLDPPTPRTIRPDRRISMKTT